MATYKNGIYTFQNVTMIFNGVPIQGFAPGEDVVRFAYQKPERTTAIVGADGSSALSISPNKAGTLSIKLLATSQSNSILSAAYLSLDTNLPIFGEILVKDSIDGTFISGGFIVQPPVDWGQGEEIPMRIWNFISPQVIHFIGGLTPDAVPSTSTPNQ